MSECDTPPLEPTLGYAAAVTVASEPQSLRPISPASAAVTVAQDVDADIAPVTEPLDRRALILLLVQHFSK